MRREVSWNREFKVILNPQWMGGLFLSEKRKNGMEKGRRRFPLRTEGAHGKELSKGSWISSNRSSERFPALLWKLGVTPPRAWLRKSMDV